MVTGELKKPFPAPIGLSHEPMRRKRLMAGSVASARLRPVARSLVEPLRHLLTPALWKQAGMTAIVTGVAWRPKFPDFQSRERPPPKCHVFLLRPDAPSFTLNQYREAGLLPPRPAPMDSRLP